MLLPRFIAGILSLGLTGVGAGVAFGQEYPSKPIRIFTTTPGGGSDFAARIIAQGITGPMGQPIVIENRGGGSLAAEPVGRAPLEGPLGGQDLARALPLESLLLALGHGRRPAGAGKRPEDAQRYRGAENNYGVWLRR